MQIKTPSGSATAALWLPALLALALGACAACDAGPAPPAAVGEQEGWRQLEPGLSLGVFAAPRPAAVGDSRVRVLRIDPYRFELRLLNASARADASPLTPREWVEQEGLVAAINASMYQEDYLSSVSLMRRTGHVNNPRLSKDKTILAFDRRVPDVPPVKLVDRECEDWETWQDRYATHVQSIRMISCRGVNVWEPQAQSWSTSAIATDGHGRVLFVHVRSPYPTHDVIEALLALPLDIERAMYVEGGTEAQMFVRSGPVDLELIGSFGAGSAGPATPLPNVIGVARRDEPLPETVPP
jgi:hypothetical protein